MRNSKILTCDIFAVANNLAEIVFDPAKNERNIAQRSLSFERLVDIDWNPRSWSRTRGGNMVSNASAYSACWKSVCMSPSSPSAMTPYASSASDGQTGKRD
jgi:hypothetical protein